MASTLSFCVLITFSLFLAVFAHPEDSHLDNQIPDQICDVDKDAVLLNSPGVVDSLEVCVAICEASTICKAVSLLPNKMCYHFTTNCLNMLETKGAITVVPQGNFEWTLVGYGKSCKGNSLASSSKQENLEACFNSCKSASPPCRSFTFLPDKTCNHFTKCENTNDSAKAISFKQHAQQHQCDDSCKEGEKFLKWTSGKVHDLAACKKSCMDEPTCQSITFWYAHSYCSHFSTTCTKRRHGADALAFRVKEYTTTASTTTPTYDAKHGVVCDVSQGEVWLSYHKVSDYAACVKSCQDSPKCKSITYYHDWKGCSHFKTTCKKTRPEPDTISKNLREEILNGKECDVSQGEAFLSSRTVDDIPACKKSCMDAAACQSITYYNHGDCSHFSTRCEKTKTVENAHSERLKDFTTTTTTANPCMNNNGGCDSKRKCTNNAGSARCGDCPFGYTNDGPKGCKDVDECKNNNGGCHGSRKCINTVGSSTCGDCASGYTNYGAKGCEDIDECKVDNGGCDSKHLCINVAGSVTCAYCPDGYENNGRNGCQDANECESNTGGCDSKRTCKNTVGSFECGDCPSGYVNDGPTGCKAKATTTIAPTTTAPPTTTAGTTDICKGKAKTACDDANGGCHSKRTCFINAGSVKCGDCPAGYKNNGPTGCLPYNDTPDVVCDGGWLSETKVSSFSACVRSCMQSEKCKSITYYPHKGCSLFSTRCYNTKSSQGAKSKNVKGNALNQKACDASQGEKFVSKTQVSDIAACRKSCSDDEACNSFVYYNHGGCDHFSTCCEKTKTVNNAHSETVSGVGYVADRYGKADCIKGTEVATKEECTTAGSSFQGGFAMTFSQAGYPNGCFIFRQTQKVYFNTHVGRPNPGASPVCTKA